MTEELVERLLKKEIKPRYVEDFVNGDRNLGVSNLTF